MTTQRNFKKWLLPVSSLAAVGFLSAFISQDKRDAGYVAHEWGTFTSVQGGDGDLLSWRPLETSRLPHFVYDWQHPGLGRQGTDYLVFGKGAMITLQRMETPVIYFYSDRKQSVDVSVKFPKGLITEWYPQAAQIGPATLNPSRAVAELDSLAHKAGAKPAFTFESWLSKAALKNSGARWSGVEILPGRESDTVAPTLGRDASGSHYFAARQTDANCLQVDSLVATNPVPEREKFIFYRGVGNFATPLRVKMDAIGAVSLENTGHNTLAHLFVLGLENRKGQFIYVASLAPGERRQVQLGSVDKRLPLEEISAKLGGQIAESLVSEGLYGREASAMVKTWKDSWFQEDGVRVLYVLPRSWTDQTLPLVMDPLPRSLVRVMVGRAEVLAPALENHLAEELRKSQQGDPEARSQVVAELRKLGRFADPAMQLATTGAGPRFKEMAWNLFQVASQPPGRAL
ncbi:MAG TPA: hypothetical protein VNZ64_18815 [Candidatus Acidoferrum sp.]|jgi:hypothetical protein|nr:hypothetical protein [Candidatus Acidoferrum sp.]